MGNALDHVNGIVASSFTFGTFEEPPSLIVRRGNAPISNFQNFSISDGFNLQWGLWNASTSTPATLFTNSTNANENELITSPIILVNTMPTNISSLTGQYHFKTVLSDNYLILARGFAELGSVDTVESINGGFFVDLAEGWIYDGKLTVCLNSASCTGFGVGFWPMHFAGAMVSGRFVNIVSGTSSTAGGISRYFDYEVSGNFLGNSANGFVLTFSSGGGDGVNTLAAQIAASTEPTRFLNGSVLFKNPSLVKFTLSSAENSTVDRIGFAIFNNPNSTIQNDSFLFGAASDSSLADAIVTSSQYLNFNFEIENYGILKRNKASSISSSQPSIGFDLKWGIWQSGGSTSKYFKNAYDETEVLDLATGNDVLFASFSSATALPTASARYSVSNFLLSGNGTQTHAAGSFDLDMGLGRINNLIIKACNGVCSTSTTVWETQAVSDLPINTTSFGIPLTTLSGFLNSSTPFTGTFQGGFIGDKGEGFVGGFRFVANNSSANLNGALLYRAEPGLSLPAPTVETYEIGWGTWNNPMETNWVVVNSQAANISTITTSDYLATVNPTPVSNLKGSASYGSTIASGFIGIGSAGVVSDVSANLDVDFNTGTISNGNLFIEVGRAQNWAIQFNGSVVAGAVDINAISGRLSDASGFLSNSINASLGGVFTGNQAQAFVGAFELLDQINPGNRVGGFYTIEK
ncbi:MAG: hypothetical protein WD772_11195 [Pseudohongiellaceae bacterium]